MEMMGVNTEVLLGYPGHISRDEILSGLKQTINTTGRVF